MFRYNEGKYKGVKGKLMRKSKIKSVKNFSGKSKAALRDGERSFEIVSKRQTFTRKTETEYVKKQLGRSDDPYMVSIEASAADFYRFIGSPEMTPKVRVVQESPESAPWVGSKKIADFSNAYSLTQKGNFFQATKGKERELARILVAAFVLEESDLHDGNWGIDKRSKKVVKIDHNLSICPISAKLSNYYYENGVEKVDRLTSHPNMIYSAAEYFSLISTADIRSLPKFTDAVPPNQPRGLETLKLAEDQEFITWKYFYFLKSLLLTDHIIKNIISDHSIDQAKDEQFHAHVKARIAALKEVLLDMPEFRQFMINKIPSLMSELRDEIKAYNKEFHNKDSGIFFNRDGSIKNHRSHRIVDIKEIEKLVKSITNECQSKEKQPDVVKNKQKMMRDLSELKARITRKKLMVSRLKKLFPDLGGVDYQVFCRDISAKFIQAATELSCAKQANTDPDKIAWLERLKEGYRNQLGAETERSTFERKITRAERDIKQLQESLATLESMVQREVTYPTDQMSVISLEDNSLTYQAIVEKLLEKNQMLSASQENTEVELGHAVAELTAELCKPLDKAVAKAKGQPIDVSNRDDYKQLVNLQQLVTTIIKPEITQADKADAVETFKSASEASLSTWRKYKKLIAAVITAVCVLIGIIAGAVVGAVIGGAAGSMTGPGAVATATIAAIATGAKGAVMGAATGGTVTAAVLGCGLFKVFKAERLNEKVVEKARLVVRPNCRV